MALTVPKGFEDLTSALTRINEEVSIMGVVVDLLRPSRSKGSDWMCSFSISDSTLPSDNQGLKVRFFKAMEPELPSLQGIGDVIILRRVKIKRWSGMTIAISSYTTTWTIFPESSIPRNAATKTQLRHINQSGEPAPSLAEMQYAIFLCNSRYWVSCTRTLTAPSHASKDPENQSNQGMTRRDKFSLIKDVEIDKYYDLLGQVVKKYPGYSSVELYITDYTSNPNLYNREWGYPFEGDRDVDELGHIRCRAPITSQWPGPFGKLTITITLWPPHAAFARTNVKEKDYVFLRNVRIKNSKDSKTEGSMHPDQRHADRVGVSIVTDHRENERVRDIQRRKLQYNERFKAQSRNFVEEARLLKRKNNEEEKPLSKGQKKRRKQHEQASKPTRRDESRKNEVQSFPNPSKLDLNTNVQCSHAAFPARPLSSILSFDTHSITTPNGIPYVLPFQNIKSRAIVRIVDFFPSKLTDFAVPRRSASEYDALSEVEDTDSEYDQCDSADEQREWEWRFALVLEDAMGSRNQEKATLTAYVADQDAEFLLKLDAQNLNTNPQALALLREKLFLLWGDLEERKSALESTTKKLPTQLQPKSLNEQKNPLAEEAPLPKSKPFPCCLKEYGIRSQSQRGALNIDAEGSEVKGSGEQENGLQKEMKEIAGNNFGWERRWRLWGTTIV